MSIRTFKVAAFGLSLEVEYWVLSKMFDLLSDSGVVTRKVTSDEGRVGKQTRRHGDAEKWGEKRIISHQLSVNGEETRDGGKRW